MNKFMFLFAFILCLQFGCKKQTEDECFLLNKITIVGDTFGYWDSAMAFGMSDDYEFISSYKWNFNRRSDQWGKSEIKIPQVTVENDGLYELSIYIENENCSSKFLEFQLKTKPAPYITASCNLNANTMTMNNTKTINLTPTVSNVLTMSGNYSLKFTGTDFVGLVSFETQPTISKLYNASNYSNYNNVKFVFYKNSNSTSKTYLPLEKCVTNKIHALKTNKNLEYSFCDITLIRQLDSSLDKVDTLIISGKIIVPII